jgi:cytochrome c oxidase subunit 4
MFLRPQILSRRSSSYLSPTSLVGLDSRWIRLPECEKGAIADHLAKVQRGDWKAMTQEEKRAAYYIAYGPYGPRAPADPAQKTLVAGWVAFFLVTSFGLWRYWEAGKFIFLKFQSNQSQSLEHRNGEMPKMKRQRRLIKIHLLERINNTFLNCQLFNLDPHPTYFNVFVKSHD